MANQKIPLQIVKFENKLLNPAKTQYRLGFLTQSVIKEDKLAENMALHSGQPASAILGVLAAIPGAINDYLEAGNPVRLEDFATFKPQIKAKSHDAVFIETDDESIKEIVSAHDITSVGIKVIPVGQVKEIVNNFQYEVLDSVVEGEEEDDTEVEP